MTKATKQIKFCAAHRLLGHEGACKNLHGHNYTVEITVEARELDDVGRVIDFSVIKKKVGGWIDENWDHKTILHQEDPLADMLEAADQPVFRMSFNPTAELMAEAIKILGMSMGLRVVKVRVWETETSYAEDILG